MSNIKSGVDIIKDCCYVEMPRLAHAIDVAIEDVRLELSLEGGAMLNRATVEGLKQLKRANSLERELELSKIYNLLLSDSLKALLQDTQHKEHNCSDTEYCPVIQAEQAIIATQEGIASYRTELVAKAKYDQQCIDSEIIRDVFRLENSNLTDEQCNRLQQSIKEGYALGVYKPTNSKKVLWRPSIISD